MTPSTLRQQTRIARVITDGDNKKVRNIRAALAAGTEPAST
ncbi:hypothetical protein AB0A05_25440 [Streptomyces sp. NPDC046374]